MTETTFDDAEAGDRIVVEYESNRGGTDQTVAGEVVFVESNRGNDVTTAVWFIGEHNLHLYRVTGSTRPILCRSPGTCTEQEAVEALSNFSSKAETVRSLIRLDAASVAGAVEVVAVESPEVADLESMGDYELCAAAFQEAYERSQGGAFDALVERQERVEAEFVNATAYKPDNAEGRREKKRLQRRAQVLREGVSDAMNADTLNENYD
jgi:hypothetical protein